MGDPTVSNTVLNIGYYFARATSLFGLCSSCWFLGFHNQNQAWILPLLLYFMLFDVSVLQDLKERINHLENNHEDR